MITPELRDKLLTENKALTELEKCPAWAVFMGYVNEKLTAAQRGNEDIKATMQERDGYLREKLTLRELSNWLHDKREKNREAIKGQG